MTMPKPKSLVSSLMPEQALEAYQMHRQMAHRAQEDRVFRAALELTMLGLLHRQGQHVLADRVREGLPAPAPTWLKVEIDADREVRRLSGGAVLGSTDADDRRGDGAGMEASGAGVASSGPGRAGKPAAPGPTRRGHGYVPRRPPGTGGDRPTSNGV